MASNNIKKEMRLEFERCDACGQKMPTPREHYEDTPEGDKVRAALTNAKLNRKNKRLKR